MSVWDVLVVGFATGYLLIAWLDGSLFAGAIAWLEDGMLEEHFRRSGGNRGKAIGSYLNSLLLCPLCLAPWVCFLLHACCGRLSLLSTLVHTFASAAIAFALYRRLTLHPSP